MWNNVELTDYIKILLSKVMQNNSTVVQAKMIVSFHYCTMYFVQKVSKHKQKYQQVRQSDFS